MVRIPGIVSTIKSLSKLPEVRVANVLPEHLPISFGSGVEATTKEMLTLSKGAKFFDYPEAVQLNVKRFSERLTKSENTFLQNLVVHNENYDLLANLMENPTAFKTYIRTKAALNQNFRRLAHSKKEVILENLALMKIFNKDSYLALIRSKGFSEIEKGKLSFDYITDITPNTKIDDDYFYNLFDSIEKATDARLSKIKGLDKDLAVKLIKAADEKICKDPNELEKILKTLDDAENPELINKILNNYESQLLPYDVDSIMLVINKSKENPGLLSKLLDMEIDCPRLLPFMLDSLNGKNCKLVLSDEMLDYYINFQKTHSDILTPWGISDINDFLIRTNGDTKLLDDLFDVAKDKHLYLNRLVSSVNENNIEYLKHNMRLGNLDEEIIEKLSWMYNSEMFKDPKNWSFIDKVYDETYKPFKELYRESNNSYESAAAKILSSMRLESPEFYKKIEDLGILELMKSRKISPRILYGYRKGFDFTPEVYSDLQKLKNNESIIKKFDNFDKILVKTEPGDVVSVNGKLYINNDGKLELWNMTEEKFNELFPLIDRYTTIQGSNDCYLISVLDSLHRNPRTRGKYYKMFEQQGDDIYVTIPAYKDYNGRIKFPNGEINLSYGSADAAKHMQMLEQTYARTALRNEPITPIGKDPLTTDDIDYLVKRNKAGNPEDVLREILLFNNNIQKKRSMWHKIYLHFADNPQRLEKVKKIFEQYGTNPDIFFNLGLYSPGKSYGHAVYSRAYNPETKKLSVIDPEYCSYQAELAVDEMNPQLNRVWATVLK